MSERAEEWMHAYQSGDTEALARLYESFRKPLYCFVFRYTRNEQLSIDIVQDVFVKIQSSRDGFDASKGKVKSYLFQIAYNHMVTKLNRRKKWRTLLPFLAPTPVESIHLDDRMAVQTAVGGLPEIQRAVVLLFYYHDLSQVEIAQILGIPIGTVKSRLHSGIQLLKKELGDFGYGAESI